MLVVPNHHKGGLPMELLEFIRTLGALSALSVLTAALLTVKRTPRCR